jgi:hypothetical protein
VYHLDLLFFFSVVLGALGSLHLLSLFIYFISSILTFHSVCSPHPCPLQRLLLSDAAVLLPLRGALSHPPSLRLHEGVARSAVSCMVSYSVKTVKFKAPHCHTAVTIDKGLVLGRRQPQPRVQILVPPSATSRLLHELLGRVRLGFLMVFPFRIACVFLHVERGRSSKRVWRSPRIFYLSIKGADSKQDEMYGWKASSRNLKHLEQRSGTKSSRNQHTNTTHAQHNTTLPHSTAEGYILVE